MSHDIEGSQSAWFGPKEDSQSQPGAALIEIPPQSPDAHSAVQMRLAKSLPQLFKRRFHCR
jgi:hypothetical protein